MLGPCCPRPGAERRHPAVPHCASGTALDGRRQHGHGASLEKHGAALHRLQLPELNC